MRHSLPLIAAAVAVLLSACSTQQVVERDRTGRPGDIPVVAVPHGPATPALPVTAHMRPASFHEMPGWQEDDQRQAWPALAMSCSALERREAWRQACAAAHLVDVADLASVRHYFETYFVPYKMQQPDGSSHGLITGYYEPYLKGSRKRRDDAQVALHAVPPDMLVRNGQEPSRARIEHNRILPYWTRGQLAEQQRLQGREIVWANDAVEAFFMQVQGSGRVYLEDTGETVRLAYADQNGHSYKSIGRHLVDIGEMTLSEASAQGIREWIRENPTRQQELFNVNPRYIFFREEKLVDPSLGPKGALGVPLTGQRSIAIDPKLIPLGVPVYLSTTRPNTDTPLRQLMLAQDTGYAIRGAVRADFYWGGGEQAGNMAGSMKQQGEMWVLLPAAK